MKNRLLALVVSLVMGLAAGGCGPSEEPQTPATPTTLAPATSSGPRPDVQVTSLELGRSVNPDKTMQDATIIFKPNDTVYASIIMEGQAPTLAVKGRFTRDSGQVVEECTQNLAVSGRAVTEFHVARPDGWPVGRYNFEVLLNGNSAASKGFEIEP